MIVQSRFVPNRLRDRTLRLRAVLRKHGAFTNSRGIFDREDCGTKFLLTATALIAGSNTPLRRLEYAAMPTRMGQDATALRGDATIRVALARN